MPENDTPERLELIQARKDLKRQLQILASPIRSIDRNPELIAKLRQMIAEIDECLGESGPAAP